MFLNERLCSAWDKLMQNITDKVACKCVEWCKYIMNKLDT